MILFPQINFTVFAVVALTFYTDADEMAYMSKCANKLKEAGFIYMTGRANYMYKMLGMTEAQYKYIRLPGDAATKRDLRFREQLSVWGQRSGGLLPLRITGTFLNQFDEDDFTNHPQDYSSELEGLTEESPRVVRNAENWCEIMACHAESKIPRENDEYEERTLEKEIIIGTFDEEKSMEYRNNNMVEEYRDTFRVTLIRKCIKGKLTYDKDLCQVMDYRRKHEEQGNSNNEYEGYSETSEDKNGETKNQKTTEEEKKAKEEMKKINQKFGVDGITTSIRMDVFSQTLVKTKLVTNISRRIRTIESTARVQVEDNGLTVYDKFYSYILNQVGMTKPAYAKCNMRNCLRQLRKNGFIYDDPQDNIKKVINVKKKEKNMPYLLGELGSEYWYHLIPDPSIAEKWKKLSTRGFCLTSICAEDLQRIGMVEWSLDDILEEHKDLLESDISELGGIMMSYRKHLNEDDPLAPMPFCGFLVCMAELVAFGIDPNINGDDNFFTILPIIKDNILKAKKLGLDFFPYYIHHLNHEDENLYDCEGYPAPDMRLSPLKFCRYAGGRFWF